MSFCPSFSHLDEIRYQTSLYCITLLLFQVLFFKNRRKEGRTFPYTPSSKSCAHFLLDLTPHGKSKPSLVCAFSLSA